MGEFWYLKNQHGAEEFWHSYLVYRVQNEIDPGIGRFTEIRRMAQDICREAEIDILAAIWWSLLAGAREDNGVVWAYISRQRAGDL